MSITSYNNVGIPAVAIAFILRHMPSNGLAIGKAILIMPFIANKRLLNYLANANVTLISIEKLFIEHPYFFSKFNQLMYDNLSLTINAIQLLNELEIITTRDENLILSAQFEYDKAMGSRASKIDKASKNIAVLLEDDIENLYLNLRVIV